MLRWNALPVLCLSFLVSSLILLYSGGDPRYTLPPDSLVLASRAIQQWRASTGYTNTSNEAKLDDAFLGSN